MPAVRWLRSCSRKSLCDRAWSGRASCSVETWSRLRRRSVGTRPSASSRRRSAGAHTTARAPPRSVLSAGVRPYGSRAGWLYESPFDSHSLVGGDEHDRRRAEQLGGSGGSGAAVSCVHVCVPACGPEAAPPDARWAPRADAAISRGRIYGARASRAKCVVKLSQ